jgi:hypothetical protein
MAMLPIKVIVRRARTRLRIIEALRGDLTPIVGYLDLLARGDITPAQFMKYVDHLSTRTWKINAHLDYLTQLAAEEIKHPQILAFEDPDAEYAASARRPSRWSGKPIGRAVLPLLLIAAIVTAMFARPHPVGKAGPELVPNYAQRSRLEHVMTARQPNPPLIRINPNQSALRPQPNQSALRSQLKGPALLVTGSRTALLRFAPSTLPINQFQHLRSPSSVLTTRGHLMADRAMRGLVPGTGSASRRRQSSTNISLGRSHGKAESERTAAALLAPLQIELASFKFGELPTQVQA